ncbi:40S ribosomal protein S11 [Cavenderia fasciculata]|uniref:40S ribosomal protein S11 n=1 Tax=Cavenderia fasciculata TaxID=261658 RepID=F4Q8J4_CACFS|nr:40S ribosomal protein S11 [Cavenderia fasciculata]EGG16094.1 40S ribosomal protein S11 [Cavenderia fasciculata]|eukprot:XP_004352419.1 40S ribosomal protein S11 [Cavenderia fasciculata]
MADVQSEKAFQKQNTIFRRRVYKTQTKTREGIRYWKAIGLGFKTPAEAINGTYIDNKCPFTSDVSIRGAIFKGQVISNKMKRTVIVRRDYLHYIKKYNRFEKRHSNIPAHASPAFNIKEGDTVTIGQCRPLTKTVKFNVIRHDSSMLTKKQFKQF